MKLPPQHVSVGPFATCRPAPWIKMSRREQPSSAALPYWPAAEPQSSAPRVFHLPHRRLVKDVRGKHVPLAAVIVRDAPPQLLHFVKAELHLIVVPPAVPSRRPFRVDAVRVEAANPVAREHHEDALVRRLAHHLPQHPTVVQADKVGV